MADVTQAAGPSGTWPRKIERTELNARNVNRDAGSRAVLDVRGGARLAIDAVIGVTNLVEEMHHNIAGLAPIAGTSPGGGARGISGLVYQSVRGVAGLVGAGIDAALAGIQPLLRLSNDWPGRASTLAAVNGVVGDYLVASDNPLAIQMCLRHEGEPIRDKTLLRARFGVSSGKLLVLVHGLCMNDLQWECHGHDYRASLARDLGYTSIYLHYNSGQHICINGREFAALMQRVVEDWPIAVSEIVIVGHSMGGLVARSACHYASLEGHTWLRHLSKLIFLGTPHNGAPLERVGSVLEFLVGISPYTAPFNRLGGARSNGIKDLRHGYFLDAEWENQGRHLDVAPPVPAPLPVQLQCFAIAACLGKPGSIGNLVGDKLVPVHSALAMGERAHRTLPIQAEHRITMYGLNHFDLLSDRRVYEQLSVWLARP